MGYGPFLYSSFSAQALDSALTNFDHCVAILGATLLSTGLCLEDGRAISQYVDNDSTVELSVIDHRHEQPQPSPLPLTPHSTPEQSQARAYTRAHAHARPQARTHAHAGTGCAGCSAGRATAAAAGDAECEGR